MDRGAWWATVHGVAKSRTWQYEHQHVANIRKNQSHCSFLRAPIKNKMSAGGVGGTGCSRCCVDKRSKPGACPAGCCSCCDHPRLQLLSMLSFFLEDYFPKVQRSIKEGKRWEACSLTLWTGEGTRIHLSFPSFAPGTELDKGLDDVIWVKATGLH